MAKQFHYTFYQAGDHSSMLGLKLIHVSKRGHWSDSLYMYAYCPAGCDWHLSEERLKLFISLNTTSKNIEILVKQR